MKLRPDVDLTGHTLAARYDILALLGAGGMGAVYRARDRELDELVALKVIRSELADVPEIVARFRQEVKLARRVTHVNVARTFELGHGDGVTFCTMELIEGESLTRRLAQRGSLPIAESVAIACALCDGLAAAHAADVIHRDIKPDNVLIALDGRVVMADFGVAALRIATDGDLSGTPAYMAPEQARGEAPTPAADVYAVGVLLAEMVTGKRAFVGDAERILADKAAIERVEVDIGFVPAELAQVIGQATARDRSARIATASGLRRALAPWSHPARAVTQPPPTERDTSAIATVVVLAPRGNGAAMYLAEAVHEELLARLDRTPRLRVLPRGERVTVHGAIEVAFELRDVLTVTLTGQVGAPVELRLALAVDQIGAAADAISAMVAAAVARNALERDDRALEADDLLLQVRYLHRHNQWFDGNAIGLLVRARELAPANPRVGAALAIGHVRMAFFQPDPDPRVIVQAAELARDAVIAAPHLVDSQLAAGLVALESGDSAAAARHFRAAIACSPHSAEAHQLLGGMLLEAGYLDAALVRLHQAIAIAPTLASARWEIARAYMLDERFDDYERMVTELIAVNGDRPLVRSRYAWWRRDREMLTKLQPELIGKQRLLVPGLLEAMFAVYVDNGWEQQRDGLIAYARMMPKSGRRASFVSQLLAEAAGFAGDIATCNMLVDRSVAAGLYDLHWLDRCPLLECVRSSDAFARARVIIKQRADAILDALYGEHHVALSETAIASRV